MRSFIELDVKTGRIRSFYGDLSLDGIEGIQVRRVSRVVPKNRLLRFAFLLLRRLFSEEGKVAHWTRRWKCRWLLEMDGRRFEFEDREEAVEFERCLWLKKITKG